MLIHVLLQGIAAKFVWQHSLIWMRSGIQTCSMTLNHCCTQHTSVAVMYQRFDCIGCTQAAVQQKSVLDVKMLNQHRMCDLNWFGILIWYTKPVQITHSVLIQHFHVKNRFLLNRCLCTSNAIKPLVHYSNTGVLSTAMVQSHGTCLTMLLIQVRQCCHANFAAMPCNNT